MGGWAAVKASPVAAVAFLLPIQQGPVYDANGNQKNLTATGESISWNAQNQPISMNGVTATYDALGRMVETGSGSSYQQFVFTPDGNPYAIYNAGTSTLIKGTVPLPGGDTAIYNQSGLSYLRHTDWLGSSRLATTWAHAVYSKTAYAPFGETYNEAGTADRSFTGQDQDVVSGSGGTGAYDFLYRKQDPSAGRWLSPDPYGWGAVDQTNPQTLNRYAYVGNQPMNSVDPNGEWWCVASAFQSTEGGYDATQGGMTCYSDGDGAYIASNPGALLYDGTIYTYSGWNASTGYTGLTVAGYYYSVSSMDSTLPPYGSLLPFCVQYSCPSGAGSAPTASVNQATTKADNCKAEANAKVAKFSKTTLAGNATIGLNKARDTMVGSQLPGGSALTFAKWVGAFEGAYITWATNDVGNQAFYDIQFDSCMAR